MCHVCECHCHVVQLEFKKEIKQKKDVNWRKKERSLTLPSSFHSRVAMSRPFSPRKTKENSGCLQNVNKSTLWTAIADSCFPLLILIAPQFPRVPIPRTHDNLFFFFFFNCKFRRQIIISFNFVGTVWQMTCLMNSKMI
jgi:hypothetical protein